MSTLAIALLVPVAVIVALVAVLFGVVWFAGTSGRREQLRRLSRTA
jgi:nitrogen fixation-related uncharacterized protein